MATAKACLGYSPSCLYRLWTRTGRVERLGYDKAYLRKSSAECSPSPVEGPFKQQARISMHSGRLVQSVWLINLAGAVRAKRTS